MNWSLKLPKLLTPAALYSNVSSSMMSMVGLGTAYRLIATRANSGGNQPSAHSQWASRKVIVCPIALAAPNSRAVINPDRGSWRKTLHGIGNVFTYLSSCSPRCSSSLSSSTRMISLTSSRGVRLMMLHKVRTSVHHASLWKIMMIEVLGSASGWIFSLHLEKDQYAESNTKVDLLTHYFARPPEICSVISFRWPRY